MADPYESEQARGKPLLGLAQGTAVGTGNILGAAKKSQPELPYVVGVSLKKRGYRRVGLHVLVAQT